MIPLWTSGSAKPILQRTRCDVAVKYVKPSKMNHPYGLSDKDIERITAVVEGKLGQEWISLEEMEAFQDHLYDHLAAKLQTHEGSMVIQ